MNDFPNLFKRINAYFFISSFVCLFATKPLTSQDRKEIQVDTAAKRKIIGSLNGSPINYHFNGPVLFDGELLKNGLQSISYLPIDTIRTITFIRGFSVPDSLLYLSSSRTNGILILSTSKDTIGFPGKSHY